MNKLSERNKLLILIGLIVTILLTAIITFSMIFIKADEKSLQARVMNHCVIESTSIAETLKASSGNLEKTGQLLRTHKLFNASENTLTLYYDENLKPAAQVSSPYKAVIQKTSLDNCYLYDITISETETNRKIYTLSFKAL